MEEGTDRKDVRKELRRGVKVTELNIDWVITRRCSSTNQTIRDISRVLFSWILSLGLVRLLRMDNAPLAKKYRETGN